MARKHKKTESFSGNSILLVDDDVDYLESTRLLLEREGHEVITATNGAEAIEIAREHPVNLILLDYYMPGMNGEEVVRELRTFNATVQVILQTGYASEKPPREMLKRLDIQGYYDKSEGPDKLLLWTDVGLKIAYTIQLLNKNRRGLRYILDITPELHKIQPLEELLQGILWQIAGLLGAVDSFLAVFSEEDVVNLRNSGNTEGFIAILTEDTDLVICAATGRFQPDTKVDSVLDSDHVLVIQEALRNGENKIVDVATIVPLRVGEMMLGLIYLDRPVVNQQDLELLQLFANQAAVAIQNTELYEMAALDPLTGVYARVFFEKMMLRELRVAFRAKQPLSLIMLDMDGLKNINDTAGHLAGDQALSLVGKIMRQTLRGGDIVGRYGGDEFIALLPQTSDVGATLAGSRLLKNLRAAKLKEPHEDLSLRASIGLSTLNPHSIETSDVSLLVSHEYFHSMIYELVRNADLALYKSKDVGGNEMSVGPMTVWKKVPEGEILT